MIDINEYLDTFPGVKSGDNIDETEFNGIILDSIPNGWNNYDWVEGLIVKLFLLKRLLTCLNEFKLQKIFMELL